MASRGGPPGSPQTSGVSGISGVPLSSAAAPDETQGPRVRAVVSSRDAGIARASRARASMAHGVNPTQVLLADLGIRWVKWPAVFGDFRHLTLHRHFTGLRDLSAKLALLGGLSV